MANVQTGLMQQVADQGSFDVADHAAVSLWPTLRQPPAPHCPASVFARPRVRSRVPIGQVGRSVQDGAEQPGVHELVAILLRQQSQSHAESYIDALLTGGFSAEHIYLRLFQPTARRLGELWAADSCTFVDVTLAMVTLQKGLRQLEPHFHRKARPAAMTRSVFLSTLGGDQHTFGLAMTAEFFRRSGWSVCSVAQEDSCDLADRLRWERNAVVGFSVSRVDQLDSLAAAIRQLRRLGRERIAGVVVGGPVFVTHPECARVTGADAVGFDARQAVAEAETLASAAADRG